MSCVYIKHLYIILYILFTGINNKKYYNKSNIFSKNGNAFDAAFKACCPKLDCPLGTVYRLMYGHHYYLLLYKLYIINYKNNSFLFLYTSLNMYVFFKITISFSFFLSSLSLSRHSVFYHTRFTGLRVDYSNITYNPN